MPASRTSTIRFSCNLQASVSARSRASRFPAGAGPGLSFGQRVRPNVPAATGDKSLLAAPGLSILNVDPAPFGTRFFQAILCAHRP